MVDNLINYKNSLKTHVLQNQILDELTAKIKLEIPKLNLLKHDVELVKCTLTLIENKILEKDKKDINTDQLCITILIVYLKI